MGRCTVKQIAALMDQYAPEASAEAFDNVGLLVGDEDSIVTGIVVTLDVNNSTIDLALEKNCNLIIAHHPLLFSPLKKIVASDALGKLLIRLLANGISVYAAHTNFDIAKGGTDDRIAAALCLEEEGFLEPNALLPQRGVGRYGTISPCTAEDLKKQLEAAFHCRAVTTAAPDTVIRRVASCAGAGGSVAQSAAQKGVQLFVTGELSYHTALDLKREGVDVLLLSHQMSEQPGIDSLKNTLQILLKGVQYNIPIEQEPVVPLFRAE